MFKCWKVKNISILLSGVDKFNAIKSSVNFRDFSEQVLLHAKQA